MGITAEQYEKMMRFLDAGMGTAEMDAFEKELAANPEMRQQLDFEQSLRDDFVLQNITRLPGTVPVDASKIPGKVAGTQRWLTIGIGSAASVIIAFSLFTVLWKKPGPAPGTAIQKSIDTAREKSAPSQIVRTAPAKDSSEVIDHGSLFKQYFKKDALPGEYPIFLAEALIDYESGNYATLQKLSLKDLPQVRGTGNDKRENILQLGHYYKGISYLETGNTKKAITHFDQVLKTKPDKALLAKTEWYLALAYLKNNDRDRAVQLCRNIVNGKESKILAKDAEKILNTLKK